LGENCREFAVRLTSDHLFDPGLKPIRCAIENAIQQCGLSARFEGDLVVFIEGTEYEIEIYPEIIGFHVIFDLDAPEKIVGAVIEAIEKAIVIASGGEVEYFEF
jgi:hypothetical protein